MCDDGNLQPRKLRHHIEGLITSTKDLPNRMRQYAAFEYVQDVLKSRLKMNTMVGDLKSEALKERHWKQLFKTLKVPSNVTLSQYVALSSNSITLPNGRTFEGLRWAKSTIWI
jgi:hypothetical protein